MKYIDAEKLLAEIKIIQQSLESRDVRLNQVKKIRTESLIEFCKCITDAIESLQQEQSKVDLQKGELPKKYETPDWLWVYGNIGLTGEHIKRLNNAINILESLNEHTDAKYLKEIKNKLLADAPMQ